MYTFDTTVSDARRSLLVARLRETNTSGSPVLAALRGTVHDTEVPLDVTALDPAGGEEFAGGLVGHVWARWLHIDYLWVAERHRGTGLGGELVGRAERLARDEHGCRFSRVETWDFQAPEFYRKVGYTLVSELPDYPPGVTDHLFTKSLS
ncbi:GNAT family N-acetyltransferase [Streptomyces sp. GSL17-111]|uniref:GNAT family N-acetyltransferase n=1 Tax=Streptomyces sp. GSL17-111 TaxID=3121596 RepID=UPI0030F42025